MESIRFVAHSIKGSAGNLGFKHLCDAAAVMENRARAGEADDFADLLLDMQTLLEDLKASLPGR